MSFKVNITYRFNDYSGCYEWLLDTSDGVGVMVSYLVKPTKRQVRKQKRAISKCSYNAWGKRYCKKTGKFL